MSDVVKAEAFLGHARYTIEEQVTPGTLKLSRFNADGQRDFYVPTELILQYLAERFRKSGQSRITGFLRQALGLG